MSQPNALAPHIDTSHSRARARGLGRRAGLRAFAVAAFALLLLLPFAADAQLDSGHFRLLQDGDEVGAIYVPEQQDPCSYVEHWYVFEGYTYPGAQQLVSTVIEPTTEDWSSVEEFMTEMSVNQPNGHYILVEASDQLPGCQ